MRKGLTYESLRRFLPEPPRSKIYPLRWNLSPADLYEFYLTRIDDDAWNELYLKSGYAEQSTSELVAEWDREIFG